MKYILSISALLLSVSLLAQQARIDTLTADSVKGAYWWFSTQHTFDTTAGFPMYFLGNIPIGSTAKIYIYTLNPYEDTLYIEKFVANAGCNGTKWETAAIPPHQTRWIQIFDQCFHGGPSQKSATLAARLAGSRPHFTIRYRGFGM